MDPILDAFKEKRKLLEAELKRVRAAELAYEPEKKVTTYVLTKDDKDAVWLCVGGNAGKLGIRAVEVAKLCKLPTQPVLVYLRRSPEFRQVNEGKRNQRFRQAETTSAPSASTVSAPGPVKPKAPKAKRKFKRSAGADAATAKAAEVRKQIRVYTDSHYRFAAWQVNKGLPNLSLTDATIKRHLDALVEAGVLKSLGQLTDYRETPGRGRSPSVYENSQYTPKQVAKDATERKPYRFRPGQQTPPYPKN